MTKKIVFISLLVATIITPSVKAIELVWTGAANDAAFFNENNWKNPLTNVAPAQGTIDPGVAIQANLLIENATVVIGGGTGVTSDIIMGTGNFTLRNSTLKMATGKLLDMGSINNQLLVDGGILSADNLKNATTTLINSSKLYLFSASVMDAVSTLAINSNDAWLFAPGMNTNTAISSLLPRVRIFGASLVDMNNARIAQYYNGCAITYFSTSHTPLTVFDAPQQSGNATSVPVFTIQSGSSIPSGMNNKIYSFKLKKGYMATFAQNDDGTGISKVYIASETDLTVNTLPPALAGSISFIRVMPWNWVNKKGTGGDLTNPYGSWFYDWGLSKNTNQDREYAAMCWGKGGLDTPAERNTLINKKEITHIMSFNEADDCSGQSGQFGLLCDTDTAALWHRHAMKVGLRIVSPSCRESAELGWLKTVNNIMVPAGARMDVIGMHWYDWSGYNNNLASDANSIFTRFKSRVTACYNYYKMPIWITEFNANKNRSRAIQDAFLQLALPWLETVPYVERYAYFQPDGGNGSFTDATGALTSTGLIYLNHISTPSIPEETVNLYVNNLQSRMNEVTALQPAVKKKISYHYNSSTSCLFINSESQDDFNMYNLQGLFIKSLKANTTNNLSNIAKGVYLLCGKNHQPVKVIL